MSETTDPTAGERVCDWCEKPAPEGDALLSMWWADYECCSMECATLAEAEDRTATPAEPDAGAGERACDEDFGHPGSPPHPPHEWDVSVQDQIAALELAEETFRCPGTPAEPDAGDVDSTALVHYPGCENTGPDGAGCNCGAYARAVEDAGDVSQHHRRHNRCGLGDPGMCGHPDCPDMTTPTAGERPTPREPDFWPTECYHDAPAEPDPTAGERKKRSAWVVCKDEACPTAQEFPAHAHRPAAEPDAGDVEALAVVVLNAVNDYLREREDARKAESTRFYGHPGAHITECFPTTEGRLAAIAAVLSPALDAVCRKAGDDRAKQIAQIIDSASAHFGSRNFMLIDAAYKHAARIARETR